MSDNHISQPGYTVTLSEQELGIAITALYEAALPMKLTAPLAMKLQALRTPVKQEAPSS